MRDPQREEQRLVRFQGALTINAARATVWRFLTDPEAVSRCAPGVESLEILAPNERFRAVASVGFGAVRASFVTDVEWLDLDAPRRARMKVHGTAPGSAVDATSEMELGEGPEGTTELRWLADVSVVGTIASIAARLMSGVAQRLTDAFFEQVRKRIEAGREFRFGPVPVDQTEGKILGHNVAGEDGWPALAKGRVLTGEDVGALRARGRTVVYVAEPRRDDVDEDTAARRLAQAAMGLGLRLSGPVRGRADLVSTGLGVARVDAGRLLRLNECEGIAAATVFSHVAVRSDEVVATIKVIPFALPETTLRAAEAIASQAGPLLRVDPMPARDVALVLSGPPSARDHVFQAFEPPLRSRIEGLGSRLVAVDFVTLEDEAGEASLAETLRRRADAGAGLIVLAGETAIVDRHDVVPRAVERAGGEVVCFGVPVDPGSLLLLAYLGPVPVLGAPGCARSPAENVLDQVLPRLLACDRLGRADLLTLGHGGLRQRPPSEA